MAADDSTGGLLGGSSGASTSGGLLGGIDPDLLLNLGFGLMSAAKYRGNLGDSLSGAVSNYYQQKQAKQSLAMNQLQLQMAKSRLPGMQQFYSMLGGLMGDPAPSDQSTTQAAPPQLQQMPQQAPQQQPSTVPSIPPPPSLMGSSAATQAPMPMGAPPQMSTRPVAAPAPYGSPAVGARAPGPDPFSLLRLGTYGAAFGAPGAQELADYAKTMLQYNPQVAQSMAVAKDQVSIDQAQIQQAAARGDYTLAAQLQQKIAKDTNTLDVQRGTRSLFDTSTGQWRSIDTATGMSTNGANVSLAPGAAQATQQHAAAQALGQAQGELVPLVDPTSHQTYMVPKSTLLGGGSAGTGVAGRSAAPAQQVNAAGAGGAPGGRALAALSPGQSGYLGERGKESAEYVRELQDAADAATNTNYSLDQMIAAGSRVQLGPTAGVREWMENAKTALGQPFGVEPPQQLANYQELDKYANQIAFAATRQMGSREAAQIVHLQMESNPNKQLVPEAFTGLAQSMKAMNNYMIAKNSAIQAQSGADNDSALQAASAWTSRIDPRVWALSISPNLATRFASSVGVAKIATALPAMDHDDGISVIRNIPQSMRAQVLTRLPMSVKQEILSGMQQSGATGTY
ncbi:MAG: hypothetical protein ACRD3Q_02255 [Terriglobales bacterium]